MDEPDARSWECTRSASTGTPRTNEAECVLPTHLPVESGALSLHSLGNLFSLRIPSCQAIEPGGPLLNFLELHVYTHRCVFRWFV